MEIIKFDRIVSVNSELHGHAAQNILNGEISPNKNWMCEKGTEKAVIILQLQRAAILSSVHLGNAHSAFVEVLVGKAADNTDKFESLIPMSVFMNPHESKTGTNANRTRFFKKGDFDETAAVKTWDRIKIVCSQPFNRYVPYGLCFVEVHGEKEPKKPELSLREDKDDIEIGSFFKKRNSGGNKTETVSEQIRKAEKDATKRTPLSIAKISEKFSSEKERHPKKEEEKQEKTQKEEKKQEKMKKEEKKQEKTKKEEEKQEKTKKDTPSKKEKETRQKEKETHSKTEKETKALKRKTEEKVENAQKRAKRKKAFEKLMEDVVLVISGFQNPLRGEIRSKALDMGAKYSGDWGPRCTHLVCAYENTPKFKQVQGKGKIVRKDWVEKCHEDRKRYPWRRFALDKAELKRPESEEEMDAEPDEEVPSCSGVEQGEAGDDYDGSTDAEEDSKVDTADYPMPFLHDFLSSKRFYIDPNLESRSRLERYVVAYNGILSEKFDGDVEYYVTEVGGAPLKLFREKAVNLVAVKPSWIWEMNAKEKWVPTTRHLAL